MALRVNARSISMAAISLSGSGKAYIFGIVCKTIVIFPSSLLGKLQTSDTLVVTQLDRFARTAIEGVQTVRSLFERGVKVHILNMGLVENTLTGNLILTVMLAFAEYERGMIVERTQTGKSLARQNPNFKDGRPRKYTDAQIRLALDLLATGKSYGQVQKMTGISKSTLIRARNCIL